jgi:ankyrin repeat protein
VNLLDQWQQSPLFLAAYNMNKEAVTALCKAGADPNLGNPSPLNSYDISGEMKSLIRQLATC